MAVDDDKVESEGLVESCMGILSYLTRDYLTFLVAVVAWHRDVDEVQTKCRRMLTTSCYFFFLRKLHTPAMQRRVVEDEILNFSAAYVPSFLFVSSSN